MNINERRTLALRIFESAVESVLPDKLIKGSVVLKEDELHIHDAVYTLKQDQKVHVFGSGKASVGMAKSLLSVLKERIAGGTIVTSQLTNDDLSPLVAVQGSHPVPDQKSISGAELLIDGLSQLSSNDFFIYLLSGGSSALIEKPTHTITLEEMQETTRQLLHSNVPIQQINAIRKHLSMIKGGSVSRFIDYCKAINEQINANIVYVVGIACFCGGLDFISSCRVKHLNEQTTFVIKGFFVPEENYFITCFIN